VSIQNINNYKNLQINDVILQVNMISNSFMNTYFKFIIFTNNTCKFIFK